MPGRWPPGGSAYTGTQRDQKGALPHALEQLLCAYSVQVAILLLKAEDCFLLLLTTMPDKMHHASGLIGHQFSQALERWRSTAFQRSSIGNPLDHFA